MTTAPDRPIVDEPLLPGALLDGRYLLGAAIGRGGVATVHRADDTALGRTVAVKLFDARAEGLHDPSRRSRETAVLASVTHPSLVTLFDAGHDAATGREFLVMELVDGPDLSRRFADGPLEPAELAELVRELSEGLYVIHSRGIVHRDVKPANVLLAPSHLPTRAWHAKLADFGIARLVDDAGLTATGQLVGTPGYLSPEQVRGQGADAAADVYALGLVAIEAATGERVFAGSAIEAASARLVRDPEVPEWLGEEWRDLLVAMVARDPADRPSALDVAVRVSELPLPGSRPAGSESAGSGPGEPQPGEPESAGTDDPTGADDPAGRASSLDEATVAIAAPTAAGAPTAATLLLPASAGLGGTAVGAGLRPRRGRAGSDGALGGDAAQPGAAQPGTAPTTRRRLVVASAALVAVVLAVATVAMISSALLGGFGGQSATDPSTSPLPSVEGELGVHLEQLEEAVTP